MAIRHVITIQAAPGRSEDFARAFEPVRAAAIGQEGCEQYDLFRSVEDPEHFVMLERWSTQELLERHMADERSGDTSALDALVALWAPGTTPTLERYES